MKLSDITQNIGVIISVITGLGTVLTVGIKLVTKYYNFIHLELEERKKNSTRLEIIIQELTPNHGSSLKDKVNKIDEYTTNNQKLIQMISDRQKWILDKQQIPIFESDGNGECTWANDAYLEFLQRDSTDVLGNGWKSFIHQDDRERVITEWDNAVLENRSSQNSYRMVKKDGTVVHVECYATKHSNNGYSGNIKIK